MTDPSTAIQSTVEFLRAHANTQEAAARRETLACRRIRDAANEIEALRDVLLAFSFHATGLRTPDWDPIYTAVGSLTGEQQDVLRGVLNPVDSGSSGVQS